MPVWAILLIIFVSILVIVSAIIVIIASRKIYKITNEGYDRRIYQETMNGQLDWHWYENVNKNTFHIKSQSEYELYCEFFPCEIKTKKTVVCMHGYGANHITSLAYARMFLDLGYNAFVFDNTNCGKSGGKLTTMGIKELEDLMVVVDKAKELTGDNAKIGLHGVSMGSATAMRYPAKRKDIEFVIEDCGFSDWGKEFKYEVHKMHRLPIVFVPMIKNLSKLYYGIKYKEISPLKDIEENDGYRDLPMLFIHGKLDEMVPFYMMEELYEAKKGFKKKAVFNNAIHARCKLYDSERYQKEVKEFLDEINF